MKSMRKPKGSVSTATGSRSRAWFTIHLASLRVASKEAANCKQAFRDATRRDGLDRICSYSRTGRRDAWSFVYCERGFRVKLSKCQFLQLSVQYFGHKIDQDGLHSTEEKVKAIKETPSH